MSREQLAGNLLEIALNAGAIVMKHYEGEVTRRQKADHSPVTAADEETEEYILHRLRELSPGIPVVAEESAAAGHTPIITGETFFLVDPLDGTKEFLSRNGEFTVNIALIERGVPVLGVVYAPAVRRLFWGWDAQAYEQKGQDTDPRKIATRSVSKENLVAVASRSHRDAATDAFLARHNISNVVSAGSSLKFCLLAAGEADIYPRMAPTMEWDTAAGHAILLAAGGRVTLNDETTPLSYGKTSAKYLNPNFVAWAR